MTPSPVPAPPQTTEELLRQALEIEREAVARYEDLADVMATHNNHDVAALFRKMARIESEHVAQILAELGGAEEVPAARPTGAWGGTAPETVPFEELHYLMHPWHALQAALAAERRAEAFFAALAEDATNDGVRSVAAQMRDEESAHVRLVEEWLARVPQPDPAWADDPDPPRYLD